MMTRRIPAVCVVLVLFGAPPATAQPAQQMRLKGVTAVDVLIEGLVDDSATCGITETGLTTAVNKALLDNGVGVADKPIRMTLYVNVNTQHLEAVGVCVSHVGVELYTYVTATPPHSAQPVFGQFTLADNSGMNTSLSSVHRQRIWDMVFQYVEAIAVDIRVANQ